MCVYLIPDKKHIRKSFFSEGVKNEMKNNLMTEVLIKS